jgi:hypothetical protein
VLVLIVVLGGLAASAVVGVNAMTGSDSATTGLTTTLTTTTTRGRGGGGPAQVGLGGPAAQAAAATCRINATAATTASAAYFAGNGGAYPTKWSDMTAPPSPTFALGGHVVINARNPEELDGIGWKLLMSGGGPSAPDFVCK